VKGVPAKVNWPPRLDALIEGFEFMATLYRQFEFAPYTDPSKSCLILSPSWVIVANGRTLLPISTVSMRSKSAKTSRISLVQPSPNRRLVSLLMELAPRDGFLPSRLPEVSFMRTARHIRKTPITYEPGIFIVAQGRKVGFLGDKRFVYDPDHYLVLSVPLPFECETYGSPEEPLLAVRVGVTPAAVTELLMQMEQLEPANGSDPQAMQATPLEAVLRDATIRLLESLRTADDSRILGPQIVREIIYHVLRGKLGRNLRALAAPDSHFARIGRVLHRIHTDYAGRHDVAMLAREAGMSVAAFHTRFKAVTAASPLQYLKNIRLQKARMLMVNEGINASGAAVKVGYESASQFSREFKRLFGDSPAAVAAEMRRHVTWMP
jgi:AraC-like DNA-binding protein